MIDADLARLYGTQTRTLNQAVRRNRDRFPQDFVFHLTKAEKEEVITNCDHLARLRFSPALPYAFTEHGALMAASVLNTSLAVEVSVFVVRAFVQLRELLVSNRELALKLKELEQRLERRLDTHDQAITEILHAIRQLMAPPQTPKKRKIGFVQDD